MTALAKKEFLNVICVALCRLSVKGPTNPIFEAVKATVEATLVEFFSSRPEFDPIRQASQRWRESATAVVLLVMQHGEPSFSDVQKVFTTYGGLAIDGAFATRILPSIVRARAALRSHRTTMGPPSAAAAAPPASSTVISEMDLPPPPIPLDAQVRHFDGDENPAKRLRTESPPAAPTP